MTRRRSQPNASSGETAGADLTLPEGLTATPFQIAGEDLVVFRYALDDRNAVERSALTPAERDIAALVAAGLDNSEIATRRGTSVRTVANQVASILRKLRLDSRRQVMLSWGADSSRDPRP